MFYNVLYESCVSRSCNLEGSHLRTWGASWKAGLEFSGRFLAGSRCPLAEELDLNMWDMSCQWQLSYQLMLAGNSWDLFISFYQNLKWSFLPLNWLGKVPLFFGMNVTRPVFHILRSGGLCFGQGGPQQTAVGYHPQAHACELRVSGVRLCQPVETKRTGH